jgi:hypothetical protein
MNIYKARYRNALRKAASINRYLKKGYHVLYDDQPIRIGFVMKDGELCLKLSNQSFVMFYQNSPDWDHGYWTTIKKWNKEFLDSFQVYAPSAKIKL